MKNILKEYKNKKTIQNLDIVFALCDAYPSIASACGAIQWLNHTTLP